MRKNYKREASEGFKDLEQLDFFEEVLFERNQMMFFLWKIGYNLALRVSDVLKITVVEAEQYVKSEKYNSKDTKTKKDNTQDIQARCLHAFKEALKLRRMIKNDDNEYLFISDSNRAITSNNHFTRQSVYRVFSEVTEDCNIKISIGTHSMRKTWGYQAHLKNVKIEKIMKKLKHSSAETTLNYIGITREEMAEIDAELDR
ncbi:MAG: tyrosine-type recombinase/integrase [Fusobacteriaceae bacterium]